MTQFKKPVVIKEKYNKGVVLHEPECFDRPANIVLRFVERWGMVQGVDDGEDSAGRSKLKLMSEEAVVNRAVLMTEVLLKKIKEKNWTTDVSAHLKEQLQPSNET